MQWECGIHQVLRFSVTLKRLCPINLYYLWNPQLKCRCSFQDSTIIYLCAFKQSWELYHPDMWWTLMNSRSIVSELRRTTWSFTLGTTCHPLCTSYSAMGTWSWKNYCYQLGIFQRRHSRITRITRITIPENDPRKYMILL